MTRMTKEFIQFSCPLCDYKHAHDTIDLCVEIPNHLRDIHKFTTFPRELFTSDLGAPLNYNIINTAMAKEFFRA